MNSRHLIRPVVLGLTLIAAIVALSCSGPPVADALTVVQTACASMSAVTSYDVEYEARAPGQSIDYSIRVSGEDYHLTGTIDVSGVEGVSPINGKVELVVVGGINLFPALAVNHGKIVSDIPPEVFIDIYNQCYPKSGGHVTRSGEESVRSENATKYTATYDIPSGPTDRESTYNIRQDSKTTG